MKKLTLIFLLLIGLGAMAQEVDYNFKDQYDVASFTVTKDTTWTFNLSTQYFWEFQFIWTTLDATDGYVKIQISQDGTNFDDYPNLDSLLLSSASGTATMRDTEKGTLSKKIRIALYHGTVSSGTFIFNGNIGNKK